MPGGMFVTPPRWISNDKALQNVISNQLFGKIDASLFSTLSNNDSLEQGIKQYQYWKKELQPSVGVNTVILSFLGSKGLELCNVLEVVKALNNVCSMSNLIEVYQASNSKFYGFTFADASEVEKITSRFLYFKGLIVAHVAPPKNNSHNFRLLWLPPVFPVEKVHALMRKYTAEYLLKKESIKTGDASFTPTNNYSGSLTPIDGTPLSALPHLVRLPPPHRGCALLIIDGRSPLCLKCRKVGHLRRNCDYLRCTSCSQMHSPTQVCGIETYAMLATRNIAKSSNNDWLDNTDDGHIMESNTALPSSINKNTENYVHNTSLVDDAIDISNNSSDSPGAHVPLREPVGVDICKPTIIINSNVSLSGECVSPPVCGRSQNAFLDTSFEQSASVSVPDDNFSMADTSPDNSSTVSDMDVTLEVNNSPRRSSSLPRRAPKRRPGRSLSPRKRHTDESVSLTSLDIPSIKLTIQSSNDSMAAGINKNRSSLALRSEFVSYSTFSSTSVEATSFITSYPENVCSVEGIQKITDGSEGTSSVGELDSLSRATHNEGEGPVKEMFEDPPSDYAHLLRSTFGFSDLDIGVVRSMCKQRKITMAMVRKITCMKDYGYSTKDIIGFPQLLKIPEVPLKKRLKAFMKNESNLATLYKVYHAAM